MSLEADPARGIVVASGVGRIRRPLSCGAQSPGKDNKLLFPAPDQRIGSPEGPIRCKERLGGLLKHYYRKGRLTSADLLRDSNGNRASTACLLCVSRASSAPLVRSGRCNSGSEGPQFHTAAPFWRPTSHDTPLRTARNSFTGRRLRFNEFLLDHTGSDSLLTQAISHRDLRGTAITEVRLTRGLYDSAYR